MDVLLHDGGLVRKLPDEYGFPEDLLVILEDAIRTSLGYTVRIVQKSVDYVAISKSEHRLTGGVLESDFLAMKDKFEQTRFYVAGINAVCEELPNGKLMMTDAKKAPVVYTSDWGFDSVHPDTGIVTRIPFINIWLSYPSRRTYTGFTFVPGECSSDYYNLWKGFSASSITADLNPKGLERFLEVLKNCTNPNDTAGPIEDYVLMWIAHIFQHPEERPGTSVIFKGEQGAGKDMIGEFIGNKLIGVGFRNVTDAQAELFGPHSHVLEGTLLVKIEEANGSLNRKESDRLKAVITQTTATINPKGLTAYTVPCYSRILMTTNNETPVRMEAGCRRYCVCYGGSAHKGDTAYWTETAKLFEDPGTARAVYEYLMSYTSTQNIRAIPRDEDDKELMDTERPIAQHFLIHLGRTMTEDSVDISNDELYQMFREFCKEQGFEKPLTSSGFGRMMISAKKHGYVDSYRSNSDRGKRLFLNKIRKIA